MTRQFIGETLTIHFFFTGITMAILDLETRRTLDTNINDIFISLTSLNKEENQNNREQIIRYFNGEAQLDTLPETSQGLFSLYRNVMKNDYIVQGLVKKSVAWLEVRKAISLPIEERKEDSLLLQTMLTIQIHSRNAIEKINPAIESQNLFKRTLFKIEHMRHTTQHSSGFKIK